MDSERSNLKSSSPRIKSLPSGDFFQTEGSNFQTEEELTKKAREELKEDQETRDHAIERLRELIQNEDNLHTNMSDAFLLRFLRSRKYDLERALTLVKNYCSAKANYPAIYKNLVLSNVAEVFESEMFTFLPGVDYQGRAVSLSSFHNWDTSKISSDQFLHAIILSCESILEDECFQISGVVGIVDLNEFTFQHLQQITPSFTYKAFSFMQDWCPIRFQGVFFVRGNVFFDLAFRIASPFIRSKLRQRIHFWGRNVDVLKEYFPVGTLPISLGGTHDSSNDGKNFLRHIMSQEIQGCKKL